MALVFNRDKPVAPSNVLSMAQLRTLPLADQIKILMKNGEWAALPWGGGWPALPAPGEVESGQTYGPRSEAQGLWKVH